MSNMIDITDDTRSLHAIGSFIMEYEARQNAFLYALVNRIGRTIVTSKMWNNPWSIFKKGYMEFGETVEEIFVNIGKVYSFDPEDAEETVFKREIPDVRAAFHTMNFQKLYPVTITNEQLRQAFLTWQGITDLIAKIVDQLYTAMRYDEFITMKYMLCRQALNGDAYVYKTADSTTAAALTADQLKSFIEDVRTFSNDLEILSKTYNRAGVYNATQKDSQYIILSNRTEAKVDVNVLAAAFNMEKAEFMGHMVKLDRFDQHDTERLALLFENDPTYTAFTSAEITKLGKIAGILMDKDWWMVFDMFEQMTQNYNAKGLYWNYFFHAWKTFSMSPYANCIVFYTDTTAVSSISVSPATATVTAGQNASFAATVSGSGLFDTSVKWSISGQVSTDTQINAQSGVLHVAAAETTGGTITVTATSLADSTKTGTATVTVA